MARSVCPDKFNIKSAVYDEARFNEAGKVLPYKRSLREVIRHPFDLSSVFQCVYHDKLDISFAPDPVTISSIRKKRVKRFYHLCIALLSLPLFLFFVFKKISIQYLSNSQHSRYLDQDDIDSLGLFSCSKIQPGVLPSYHSFSPRQLLAECAKQTNLLSALFGQRCYEIPSMGLYESYNVSDAYRAVFALSVVACMAVSFYIALSAYRIFSKAKILPSSESNFVFNQFATPIFIWPNVNTDARTIIEGHSFSWYITRRVKERFTRFSEKWSKQNDPVATELAQNRNTFLSRVSTGDEYTALLGNGAVSAT